MNILIFKTSIRDKSDISVLRPVLTPLIHDGRWSVDLEDCDKILRIESDMINVETVSSLLNRLGFACSELED